MIPPLPRRLVHPVVASLLLWTGGCTLTFDATRLGVPVTMASPAGAPAEGTHFQVTKRAVFGLWGLATLSTPSLQKALAAQLVGGKGVADLRVKVTSRFGDLLITGLTLGLIVPRAVTYEGVVTGVDSTAGQ